MAWAVSIPTKDLISARTNLEKTVEQYLPAAILVQGEIIDVRTERGELKPEIETGLLRVSIVFPYNHNFALWKKISADLEELSPDLKYLEDGKRSQDMGAMVAKIQVHKALRKKVLGRNKRWADLYKELTISSDLKVESGILSFRIQVSGKPLVIDTRKWARAVGIGSRVAKVRKNVEAMLKIDSVKSYVFPVSLLAGVAGPNKPILEDLEWSSESRFLERTVSTGTGHSSYRSSKSYEVAFVAITGNRKTTEILEDYSSFIQESVRSISTRSLELTSGPIQLVDTHRTVEWKPSPDDYPIP